MPYRRNVTSRRAVRRPRRRVMRRRVAPATARKLYRQIRRVEKKGSQIIWLRNRLVPTPIGDVTYSAPFFYACNNLNDSNPIFGTTAADLDAETYYHRRTTIQVKFSSQLETDVSNYTLMFVRLTKYAIDRYSMTNGGLNNLTADLHYTVNPGGGGPSVVSQASTYMLNPKFFRVLYTKRFHSLSNVTTAAGTTGVASGGLANIFTKTFYINSKYKMHNPAGDAKTLEACNRPENNWFVICVSSQTSPLVDPNQRPYIAVEEVSSWTTST